MSNPASRGRKKTDETPTRILDVAQRLVQTRGYNGFSYADIATELRITKASVHHHFPTKAELGARLISRYADRFLQALAAIDEAASDRPRQKLTRYTKLYENVLRDDRMCLCGMLAAEITTLPADVRSRVNAFFDENEAWLTSVLDEGRRTNALSFEGTARAQARVLVGSLEGAMIVSRAYSDPARFRAVANRLLASMTRTRAAG